MEPPAARRKTVPRQSLCCTECTRRKIRCSKVIPCSACIDAGQDHLCRREDVIIRRRAPAAVRSVYRAVVSPVAPIVTPPAAPDHIPTRSPPESNTPVLPPASAVTSCITPASIRSDQSPSVLLPPDGVVQDAALTLEYLALGRQRGTQGRHHGSVLVPPYHDRDPVFMGAINRTSEPIPTIEQARFLIHYHDDNIAWMHNVVHMPTFRDQAEVFFRTGEPVDKFWLPLYFALLSMTVHLTHPTILNNIGIKEPQRVAEDLHQKSLDMLFLANYMAVHSILSVQTICMLIHVAYNLGQSDLVATLMGSAIRIAHSFGMHRLGPDNVESAVDDGASSTDTTSRLLLDREMKKRIWWFLVRQDWLQITFMNTYTIHASQFNTPMPENCPENPEKMVANDRVVELGPEEYTQGTYTSVANHVAVLIWKTQDRMFSLGHPGGMQDGTAKLYEEVMHADGELKKIMKKMPRFYQRDDCTAQDGLPPHILHQRRCATMFMAHKISCLSISYRGLRALFSLSSAPGDDNDNGIPTTTEEDEEYTWIIRNMWTVNMHTVTAAIVLLFEELFANDGENDETRMLRSDEIRDTAMSCSRWLKRICHKSEIARRGCRIIDFLLELACNQDEQQQERQGGSGGRLSMEQIVAHVKGDAMMGGGCGSVGQMAGLGKTATTSGSFLPGHSRDGVAGASDGVDEDGLGGYGTNTWECILDYIGYGPGEQGPF